MEFDTEDQVLSFSFLFSGGRGGLTFREMDSKKISREWWVGYNLRGSEILLEGLYFLGLENIFI